MKCPVCDQWARVLETRQNARGTYRRYVCANEHRFTTQESHVKVQMPTQRDFLAALGPCGK